MFVEHATELVKTTEILRTRCKVLAEDIKVTEYIKVAQHVTLSRSKPYDVNLVPSIHYNKRQDNGVKKWVVYNGYNSIYSSVSSNMYFEDAFAESNPNANELFCLNTIIYDDMGIFSLEHNGFYNRMPYLYESTYYRRIVNPRSPLFISRYHNIEELLLNATSYHWFTPFKNIYEDSMNIQEVYDIDENQVQYIIPRDDLAQSPKNRLRKALFAPVIEKRNMGEINRCFFSGGVCFDECYILDICQWEDIVLVSDKELAEKKMISHGNISFYTEDIDNNTFYCYPDTTVKMKRKAHTPVRKICSFKSPMMVLVSPLVLHNIDLSFIKFILCKVQTGLTGKDYVKKLNLPKKYKAMISRLVRGFKYTKHQPKKGTKYVLKSVSDEYTSTVNYPKELDRYVLPLWFLRGNNIKLFLSYLPSVIQLDRTERALTQEFI